MNHKNIGAGLLFLIVGLFFSITSLARYNIGTPSNMGTGFLPLSIGILLSVLGFIVLLRDAGTPTKITSNFLTAFKIVGLIVLFVFLFKTVGAIIAAIVLIFGSAYLHPNFEKTKTVVVSLVVVILILIFKFLLNTPIPLWIS